MTLSWQKSRAVTYNELRRCHWTLILLSPEKSLQLNSLTLLSKAMFTSEDNGEKGESHPCHNDKVKIEENGQHTVIEKKTLLFEPRI